MYVNCVEHVGLAVYFTVSVGSALSGASCLRLVLPSQGYTFFSSGLPCVDRLQSAFLGGFVWLCREFTFGGDIILGRGSLRSWVGRLPVFGCAVHVDNVLWCGSLRSSSAVVVCARLCVLSWVWLSRELELVVVGIPACLLGQCTWCGPLGSIR